MFTFPVGFFGEERDPFWNNVVLLLPGNGTNGSTTILDVSASAKTVTTFGNAQISTTQSKFGGSSIAFDGAGDYLSVPDSSDFSYSTNSFTIEYWLYPTSLGSVSRLYHHQTPLGDQVSLYMLASGQIGFFANNSGSTVIDILSSTPVTTGTWVHIAIVRDGSTFTLYQNGASVVSGSSGSSLPDPSGSLIIGALPDGSQSLNAYLDDLRVTKGVARYIANFTPPTAPFPIG